MKYKCLRHWAKQRQTTKKRKILLLDETTTWKWEATLIKLIFLRTIGRFKVVDRDYKKSLLSKLTRESAPKQSLSINFSQYVSKDALSYVQQTLLNNKWVNNPKEAKGNKSYLDLHLVWWEESVSLKRCCIPGFFHNGY